jgi:hypothetical protein
MIGKILGAAVGRRIAGRQSGGRGLLLGALAPVIARRAFGPVGLAVGGAWLAKKAWDRRGRVRSGTAGATGRY